MINLASLTTALFNKLIGTESKTLMLFSYKTEIINCVETCSQPKVSQQISLDSKSTFIDH